MSVWSDSVADVYSLALPGGSYEAHTVAPVCLKCTPMSVCLCYKQAVYTILQATTTLPSSDWMFPELKALWSIWTDF